MAPPGPRSLIPRPRAFRRRGPCALTTASWWSGASAPPAWPNLSFTPISAVTTLNGTLYASGTALLGRAARWNGTQGWVPIGPAVNNFVSTIATGPAGTFIGGAFNLGGGYAQLLGIARYSGG